MPVPTPAPKPYLRRGAVLAWLDDLGIEPGIFRKLVSAGTIEPVYLGAKPAPKAKGQRGAARGSRAYYLREAVDLHIIQPFNEAQARLTK